MKVNYYEEEDILVVKLTDYPIAYAEESNWVVIHFDAGNQPVRIEILDASRFFRLAGVALPTRVKELFFSTA